MYPNNGDYPQNWRWDISSTWITTTTQKQQHQHHYNQQQQQMKIQISNQNNAMDENQDF